MRSKCFCMRNNDRQKTAVKRYRGNKSDYFLKYKKLQLLATIIDDLNSSDSLTENTGGIMQ